MNVSGRCLWMLAGATLWSTVMVTSAAAQTCGDADGSGTVTVTDGVQVLRSAAGLSSTCTANAANCDVDGSGGATVTDGVNVLRKAAGITITEACPGGGDTADVAEVTDVVVPFLTLGLREVPNVSFASADTVQPAGSTEDCEDGGTRTSSQQGISVRVDFDACRVSEPGIGSFQFDGQVQVQLGTSLTVSFELNVTDLSNNKVVDFDGSITGEPRPTGRFLFSSGTLIVRGANEGLEIFRLTFNNLLVDGDGHIESGSVEAEDTSDSFELKTAELEVEGGSTTATVHVVRDDDSQQDYTLNLDTGELTPVN